MSNLHQPLIPLSVMALKVFHDVQGKGNLKYSCKCSFLEVSDKIPVLSNTLLDTSYIQKVLFAHSVPLPCAEFRKPESTK